MPSFILLGPPGSGKGTQATLLSERYSCVKISTGDLIRSHIAKQTPLGIQVKSLVAKGDLVPDELVSEIFKMEFLRCQSGFLADGFPRTLTQAKSFSEWITELNIPFPKVVFFDLPLSYLLDRLLGRRTCPLCNRSYHLHLNPPKVAGICDDDGETLIQRPDDEESVIRNRFSIYQKEIEPVLSHYGDNLLRVDASQSVNDVTTQILKVIS